MGDNGVEGVGMNGALEREMDLKTYMKGIERWVMEDGSMAVREDGYGRW